jgi:hypothetical protein
MFEVKEACDFHDIARVQDIALMGTDAQGMVLVLQVEVSARLAERHDALDPPAMQAVPLH